MPKPMLGTGPKQEVNTQDKLSIHYVPHQKGTAQLDQMKTDRLLREKRSQKYMDAIKALDAGGHTMNAQQVQQIIQQIRDEFPEIMLDGQLLGIVSICYLGRPYEVHALDITGQIIEHYPIGHSMPNGMEKARGIALHGGYEFIEVYENCCRAVSSSGAVSVIYN